jgi:hypothetical protein
LQFRNFFRQFWRLGGANRKPCSEQKKNGGYSHRAVLLQVLRMKIKDCS